MTASPPAQPEIRPYAVLAVVGVGTLLSAMSGSAVHLALPGDSSWAARGMAPVLHGRFRVPCTVCEGPVRLTVVEARDATGQPLNAIPGLLDTTTSADGPLVVRLRAAVAGGSGRPS